MKWQGMVKINRAFAILPHIKYNVLVELSCHIQRHTTQQ